MALMAAASAVVASLMCMTTSKETRTQRCVRAVLNQGASGSQGVIHVELDGMCGHAQPRHVLHLESDVGVNHVIGEHTAALQELPVLVQVLERHVEGVAHLRDVLLF